MPESVSRVNEGHSKSTLEVRGGEGEGWGGVQLIRNNNLDIFSE